MKTALTIITPSYNRGNMLINLYNSLKEQSVKNFEWLIVDDGSTDNTKEIISNLQKKSDFSIKYLFKKNGGKHTALNEGIKTISSELTMIVDSDDILLPGAVEAIEKIHKKYNERENIGVYTFLRCYSSGNPIVNIECDEFEENYIKYRIREKRPGDMAEVFKTSVLKENVFPEFKDEKFLSEDVVWIQIGLKYQFVFINEAIYQCEYLEGGLTSNDKISKFSSPMGSMLRGKMLMLKECGLIQNIKGAIIYNCYKIEAGKDLDKTLLILSKREKTLVYLTRLLGIYFNKKWKPKQNVS